MIKIREVKLADARAIANVHVNTWKTAYKGLVNQAYLDNLAIERSQKIWESSISKNQSLTLVAENDQAGVIAFISGGTNRSKHQYPTYDAEIYAIYVLKEWSKQGVGTELVQKVASYFKDQGYKSYLLWMLKDNNAENFYRKIGGTYLGEKPLKIGEQDTIVRAYGWEM